jgi:PKD repeat protein
MNLIKTGNLSIVIFTFLSVVIHSQNEFRKWYFGGQAGLDFVSSPPTVLTNGIISTIEGCATICDANGNLLIYTDGVNVLNSTHNAMADATPLTPFKGNSTSTQSGIIVKQPGNQNIYYVFTVLGGGPACYSIVDMSLAAGLGSVTVKNVTYYTPTCEKQVAVRHCNGKDVWVVSHEWNSNKFRAYLLTSSGVNTTAVISTIGETPSGNGGGPSMGHLKVSPDGKKLATATFTNSVPTSLGAGGFQLFDFDAATGVVSNSLTLLPASSIMQSAGAYGVEFSPDGTKLYGTTSPALSNYTCALYQWNICAPTASAIIASQYSVQMPGGLGSVQWAVDGKLYITDGYTGNPTALSVINSPNSSGSAMNLSLNTVSITSGYCNIGLPNYINSYTRPAPSASPFTNTTACQSTSFAIPPPPTFSSGCTSVPYPYSSYLWNFGDAASGSSNTSTLTNPNHLFSTTGTYTVSLILYSPCTSDTVIKSVTITSLSPVVAISGLVDICKGDKRTYTVTGATSYVWSNNATTSTIAVAPGSSTVLSVTGSSAGCSTTKTFSINVNTCDGINSSRNEYYGLYPNPVNTILNVQAADAGSIRIFDINGKLMMESEITEGVNQLDIKSLLNGIYSAEVKITEGTWHSRFVKID